MYLQKIAQQVVENMMEVIDNRTLNIIDTSGIIVASSDKKRIGTYHKGGDDVIKYGKTIEITPEEVGQYVGTKEGVNMPINIEGKIIGVVGVFGHPEEVRLIARLVKKSVEFALKHYVVASQVKLATDLRHQLIRILIYENINEREEEILCLAQATRIDLNIGRYAVVIENLECNDAKVYQNVFKIEECISKKNILAEDDLASLVGNNYVLFIKDLGKLEKVYQVINENKSFRLGIGTKRKGTEGYKKSFLEAKECLVVETDRIVNMNDITTQSKYLFSKINKEVFEYYIKPLYLLSINDQGALPHWFTETIAELLKHNMNVIITSEALHIHKNTLIYRIKKIESLTGLSLSDNFYHIALLEMLLVYINNL